MAKGASCWILCTAAAVLVVAEPARSEVFCKTRSGLLRMRAACRAQETRLPIAIADDGTTVLVTGANVKIVNGTGATDGSPNGLGNLILGYDLENRPDVGDGPDDRTGSHNLVVGDEHTYAGTSGLVVGLDNAVTGVGASVTGGPRQHRQLRLRSDRGGAVRAGIPIGLDSIRRIHLRGQAPSRAVAADAH